ncbi:MAG TPA: hypothetical protein VNV86_14545 [Candidatus Acidoferrum sp.]|nr:hypothetical protein [Candidatus Acidoferrum sp.]
MAENIRHPHHPEPHRVGHETTDVNIWAVGRFGVGLVVMTLLSIGLLIGVFRFFQQREEGRSTAEPNPIAVFPHPQVLTDEPKNLARFRAEQEKDVTGYGWVDQSKGVVRIPVDQAIDMLLKKGVPVRPQTAAASQVSMPTESGLGIPPKAQEEIRK